MEEKRRDEIEIDWGELGGALLSKSLLILIITALCAAAAFFRDQMADFPQIYVHI